MVARWNSTDKTAFRITLTLLPLIRFSPTPFSSNCACWSNEHVGTTRTSSPAQKFLNLYFLSFTSLERYFRYLWTSQWVTTGRWYLPIFFRSGTSRKAINYTAFSLSPHVGKSLFLSAQLLPSHPQCVYIVETCTYSFNALNFPVN